MNKNTSQEIIQILRNLIPNPQCELNFSNNFELICAVMLSAQTTDKRVNMVTPELFRKYPNPESLMNADIDDVKTIIKSIGLTNNKAKNIINLAKEIHNVYNDDIPNEIEKLVKLPGVGRKTASVVLAVGFNIPAIPVDTHVNRVAYRLGYCNVLDDVLKTEKSLKKYIAKKDWIDGHHLLLLFGRYFCTAKNPKCNECALKQYCKDRN